MAIGPLTQNPPEAISGSGSSRNLAESLNLTLQAWVELFETHALSHDHEILQGSTQCKGSRRRFFLNQNLNQTPCEFSVRPPSAVGLLDFVKVLYL